MVDRKFPTDERHDPISIPEALLRDNLSTEEDFHLEEERRLFYVAMTRAKQGLYFTSANDYGGARAKKISRFLMEMGYVVPVSEKQKKTRVQVEKNKQDVVDSLIAVPSKFSFSALNMYDRCPRQFYYARVLKLPTFGKATFTFGDVIHRTLKDFIESISDRQNLEQAELFGELGSQSLSSKQGSLNSLYEIYEQNWVDEWYKDPKIKEQYYELGKEILKKFYEDFSKQKPRVKLLEQPFTIDLKDFKITGRIDRIDDLDDGVEIIDYKTGKAKDDKLKPDDKDQLLLYQIASEECLHLKPVKLTYHFLNEGKKIDFFGTDKQKEALKIKWLGRIEKIMSRDFSATPSPFVCPTCEYRDICPFRKI